MIELCLVFHVCIGLILIGFSELWSKSAQRKKADFTRLKAYIIGSFPDKGIPTSHHHSHNRQIKDQFSNLNGYKWT